MVKWGWTKTFLTMNPMDKYMTKMNTTSENMTYIVDEKKLCQHNKLNSLTARRVKWISETMYVYIEKSISMIHRDTSLQRVETIYQFRNGIIVILNMISFFSWIVLNDCV